MVAFTIKHTKRQTIPTECALYVHHPIIVLRISVSWKTMDILTVSRAAAGRTAYKSIKRGGIEQTENSIWTGLLYYLLISTIEGDRGSDSSKTDSLCLTQLDISHMW